MSSKTQPIGLIGTGLMGSAISDRLRSAGFGVLAWDHDAERLAGSGAQAARDARTVARSCARIVLSLPDSEVVARVIDEMGDELMRGTVIVDTSTGEPDDAQRCADLLHARGGTYLEATISGSSEQLRRGEALAMIGGDEESLGKCEDIFAALGGTVVPVGGSGAAARMKLVTNLVLGLNRAALAEGLAFAEALGLDPEQTAAILKSSAAYSRIMDSKAEKMIRRDFRPVARLSQHAKDLGLMLRAAESCGMSLPLTETHRQLLGKAIAAGHGDLDNSAVIEAIRKERRD
jgi:3-hydroxyisobutyrate dehydrogenase-like beta-hydroxyacid dehydrogenase